MNIFHCGYKGLSDEFIKSPTTPDNSLPPSLSYIGNKTRVKFDGYCLKQEKITFTYRKRVIYINYETYFQNYRGSSYPTLLFGINYTLFGAVKLAKNDDIEKYKYSGYGIGFGSKGTFSFPDGGFGKNVILFGVVMNSYVHVDNKKKHILILSAGPTQGLDDTALIVEKNIQSIFRKLEKSFI